MPDNPEQPREFDAVLGGEFRPPIDGVVLGGIEGVKRLLQNSVADTRAIAIIQAANYGKEGLDLIISGLNDVSGVVRSAAYEVLQEKSKEAFLKGSRKRVRTELLTFDLMKLFTILDDWVFQDFNPNFGIVDPYSIIYNVNSIEDLKTLIYSPHASKLNALSITVKSNEINAAIEILLQEYRKIINLQALNISEIRFNERFAYEGVIDVGQVLKFYSSLILLSIQGMSRINFSSVQHNYLRTLIIDDIYTCEIKRKENYHFDLPSLEHLHLSTGYSIYDDTNYLLSNINCKKLKYLGLKNFCDASKKISLLAKSNNIDKLIIINIENGYFNEKDAHALLKYIARDSLYLLKISRHNLSYEMLNKLSSLTNNIITN
jgi:hypothetical protein